MKQELNKERGSVVVEASFVLPIFVIAMFFFVNLINIFILHNKIQFAINMAAHEIAAYSYLYEKTELREAESMLQEDGKEYTEKIDDTAESIMQAANDIVKTIDSAKETVTKVGNVIESIKDVANNIDELKDKIEWLPNETKKSIDNIKLNIENAKNEFISAINDVENITKSSTQEEALENINKIIESGKADKEKLEKIKKAVIEYIGKVKEINIEMKKVYESAKETIEKGKETIDKGKETIEQGKKAVESSKTAASNVIDRIKNLKETLTGVGFIGAEGAAYFAKNKIGDFFYERVTEKYIDEAYLKTYGIIDGYRGLSFKQSTYLNDKDKKMIDIIVSYDINLTSFRLVLFTPKLKVTQRVAIPAWLDGDGQKVREGLRVGKN